EYFYKVEDEREPLVGEPPLVIELAKRATKGERTVKDFLKWLRKKGDTAFNPTTLIPGIYDFHPPEPIGFIFTGFDDERESCFGCARIRPPGIGISP
ncbi:MAG: hypothetical protein V3U86_02240, partial [Acidobacteriota bacterium]